MGSYDEALAKAIEAGTPPGSGDGIETALSRSMTGRDTVAERKQAAETEREKLQKAVRPEKLRSSARKGEAARTKQTRPLLAKLKKSATDEEPLLNVTTDPKPVAKLDDPAPSTAVKIALQQNKLLRAVAKFEPRAGEIDPDTMGAAARGKLLARLHGENDMLQKFTRMTARSSNK